MKTDAQLKFDKIIEIFRETLKPLGFKKKANNFYLQLSEIGQIINIQKSQSSNSSNILFTINIGIFEPKFWLQIYDYQHTKTIPNYPTEPECLIRKRIGELLNKGDIWYKIDNETDIKDLTFQIKETIKEYILPFFNGLSDVKKIIEKSKQTPDLIVSKRAQMIFYAEYGLMTEAREIYKDLLQNANPLALSAIKRDGQKYDLG